METKDDDSKYIIHNVNIYDYNYKEFDTPTDKEVIFILEDTVDDVSE